MPKPALNRPRPWIAAGALLAATALLLAAGPLLAADGSRGSLVTAQWLEQNLGRADLLLLDASPAPVYAKQHIPGAVNVDVFTYGPRETTLPEAEKLFRSWGVRPGSRVVLCDQGAGMMATRGFFTFLYYGFPEQKLFILDGGVAKWMELGLPVTTEAPPAPASGTYSVKRVREETRVRLPEVLAASGDPAHTALLEALGADWHFGETAIFDRGGHIPHGILLPSADFYNADKTFKSNEEIERMLAYLGVRRGEPIYTYCGGGVAASVPFFALRQLAGYPQVKLFVESELGWLADQRGLPYWTYDAPNLLRGADWLRAWGGPMMRMYGVSQVSVVDVRPAEAYAAGHVPFALSVPAGVFARHLGDPAALAAALGAAGVDRAQEAVVVSGAGLTPDAALAFVLLERVGQRRTSILTTVADAWAEAGLGVTQQATVVGPRQTPQDRCVPAVTYAAQPRDSLVIADPATTRGSYPKVFVAAGRAIPVPAPAGTVVHVPYADLIDASGAPKAAKELWAVLTKAGVPRYAELVCFADEPGEAAVDYVVLRMMGFPDVKVWVR